MYYSLNSIGTFTLFFFYPIQFLKQSIFYIRHLNSKVWILTHNLVYSLSSWMESDKNKTSMPSRPHYHLESIDRKWLSPPVIKHRTSSHLWPPGPVAPGSLAAADGKVQHDIGKRWSALKALMTIKQSLRLRFTVAAQSNLTGQMK